jgi:hypothetical protein
VKRGYQISGGGRRAGWRLHDAVARSVKEMNLRDLVRASDVPFRDIQECALDLATGADERAAGRNSK